MEQPPQAKSRKTIREHLKHINVKIVLSVIAGLLLFFLVKRYALDLVKINSRDMLSTFNYGDAVLINKTGRSWYYGDVIYFEYPLHDSLPFKTRLFQRVVAGPGDTLRIGNKMVSLNGINMPTDSSCQHNYFIKTKKYQPDSLFCTRYRLCEGGEISNEFDYSYSLTHRESEILKKDSLIKSVSLKTEKAGNFDETCFPGTLHYKWNNDHYGPLYIPRMNDTLQLDTVNIHLYKTLIGTYEKNRLEIRRDSIFINDQYSKIYVTKKNYYFVMGDNRDNSNDSRNWGFLPANCIIGKVAGILKKAKP